MRGRGALPTGKDRDMVGRKGFALIIVLGLLASLTVMCALAGLRQHGQVMYLAGQSHVMAEAEERAMLLRLAAEVFGRETGEVWVELGGRELRLAVEPGEARRSYVVTVDGERVGGYRIATNGAVHVSARR